MKKPPEGGLFAPSQTRSRVRQGVGSVTIKTQIQKNVITFFQTDQSVCIQIW
jgi:hypothetical protein